MRNITIYLRDGSKQEFVHKPRAGGSWTLEVDYRPGVVVVIDEWQKEEAFPIDLVSRVVVYPDY